MRMRHPIPIHTGTENHFSTHPKHVDIGAGASAQFNIVFDVHTDGRVLVINQIILGSFCDRITSEAEVITAAVKSPVLSS